MARKKEEIKIMKEAVARRKKKIEIMKEAAARRKEETEKYICGSRCHLSAVPSVPGGTA